MINRINKYTRPPNRQIQYRDDKKSLSSNVSPNIKLDTLPLKDISPKPLITLNNK